MNPPEGSRSGGALWTKHRQRVMDVAYRMLGTVTEAEDVAQEVYLRLDRQDLDVLEDVEGWLVTVTARLCLDELRSARVTRRTYVGPWLPEPLVPQRADGDDPADRITLDESVRLALLSLLERLSPAQRTAFVLHDVFGLPFEEIASIVGRSVTACRKLASRARQQVHGERRFTVDRDELHRVVEEFRRACRHGDLAALTATLDHDATGEFDSGGRLPGAPTTSVAGGQHVAALLLSSFDGRPVDFVSAQVNGEPGILVMLHDRIVTTISVQVADGRISHIRAIGNPAKLRHLNAFD